MFGHRAPLLFGVQVAAGLARAGRIGFASVMTPDFELERTLQAQGYLRIAGVDEVGRGPLAGPVTAAAVVLDPAHIPNGLNDSKKLTRKARERIAGAERACGLCPDRRQPFAAEPDAAGTGSDQGRRAVTVHCGGLNYGENLSRLCHVVPCATAPRIRVGDEHGIWIKKPHVCAAKTGGDPTP